MDRQVIDDLGILFADIDADRLNLMFRLGDQYFATPLLGVREVCESPEYRPIPNMIDSFLGLFNLRGELVAAVDLCKRFGIRSEKHADQVNRDVLLVFDSEKGALAALVDEIIEVIPIQEEELQKDVNFDTALPPEFMQGFARHNDQIVCFVDLPRIVSREELVQLSTAKQRAAS